MNKSASIYTILIPALFLTALMTLSLINYPAIFDNSKSMIATTYVGIIAYVVMWMMIKPDNFSKKGGFLIGLLFVVNISTEEFIDWPSKTYDLVATLGMMFVIFVSFSIISAIKTLKTKNLIIGIKSSFISALFGTAIALCFGFLINYLFSDRMVYVLQNYPGFKEYYNPKAFTFFNTFDNASTHIIIAPIISILMGTLGGSISLIILKLKKQNEFLEARK